MTGFGAGAATRGGRRRIKRPTISLRKQDRNVYRFRIRETWMRLSSLGHSLIGEVWVPFDGRLQPGAQVTETIRTWRGSDGGESLHASSIVKKLPSWSLPFKPRYGTARPSNEPTCPVHHRSPDDNGRCEPRQLPGRELGGESGLGQCVRCIWADGRLQRTDHALRHTPHQRALERRPGCRTTCRRAVPEHGCVPSTVRSLLTSTTSRPGWLRVASAPDDTGAGRRDLFRIDQQRRRVLSRCLRRCELG